MKKLYVAILLIFIGTITNAQYTKLLDFAGMPYGSYTNGNLYYDGTFLYGMTAGGGTSDMGTIFKIKPDGSSYLKLLDFVGTTNGQLPQGTLIFDGTYFYGTTTAGGINGNGTIFKIKPDGSGYVKLWEFAGAVNGQFPQGSLISDGTFLYGMTDQGGANNDGVIYKIKTNGTGYTNILNFAGATNGTSSYGSLIYDGTFLYGMTYQGGTNNYGTIFKIMTNGSGYAKLLDFAGTTNGRYPYGSLFSDGTFLYGMTAKGGISDSGTLFKIMPNGSGFVKLLDFAGISNGSKPQGSLIYDGIFLYGMTLQGGTDNFGTIFKIKTDGSNYLKLLDFMGATNGMQPGGSVISVGNVLYGMTSAGGANNFGTIFKLDPSGIGVEQLSAKNKQLNIYPNPTSDQFFIEANTTDKLTVDLYDVNGRHVFSANVSDKSNINVTTLDNGIYTLTIITADRVTNKKLIIQR